MSKVFLCKRLNLRCLPSSSWVRMNEFESDWISWVRVRVEGECFWVNLREENKVSESNMAEFKMAAIINLSQNQWVKIFVQMVGTNEWVKFFCANGGNQSWQVWVSLRGKTQMAESKMMEFRITEFKMAAIMKFSQNQWVKFFFPKGREGSVSEVFLVQMVGTNLGKCEWVWEEKLRWLNPRWWNSGLQNSRWLPSSS